jgi:hypothetical protein
MVAVNYADWLTDVSIQSGAGVQPALIERTLTGDMMFRFMGAPFGPSPLLPGATSALLVIQTNAPALRPGSVSVINGSVAEIGSFQPASEPTPGDVNGDGLVDVVDLLYLVEAFGSVTGDANYNPQCDFNHDGLVDVVDLLDVVYNFGT